MINVFCPEIIKLYIIKIKYLHEFSSVMTFRKLIFLCHKFFWSILTSGNLLACQFLSDIRGLIRGFPGIFSSKPQSFSFINYHYFITVAVLRTLAFFENNVHFLIQYEFCAFSTLFAQLFGVVKRLNQFWTSVNRMLLKKGA